MQSHRSRQNRAQPATISYRPDKEGEATGDPDQQAQGEVDQTRGKFDQAKGNVKDAAGNLGDAIKGTADDLRD